jgi:hypothetical protein
MSRLNNTELDRTRRFEEASEEGQMDQAGELADGRPLGITMGPTQDPGQGHEGTGSVLCADWTRNQGVDPVGSAGNYSGYLLIEWPLPWPRDIADVPELEQICIAANRRGIRIQAIHSEGEAGSGHHVILYRRVGSGGAFSEFERIEMVVPLESVRPACWLLLGSDQIGDVLTCAAKDVADVLICGHGKRDRCCGSKGIRLLKELNESTEFTALDGIRLWRTSHTGGHRFAPTMILLPEGTAWAFTDAAMVKKLATRTGDLQELIPRYRGCSGLASPSVQVIERAALAALGWKLFGSCRWSEELPDSGLVRLHITDELGEESTWEGEVVEDGKSPVPQCGLPISEATKWEPHMSLKGFRRLE